VSSKKYEFIGGSLCLDLANTLGGARGHNSAAEHLTSYLDLLNWARQAGLVSEKQEVQLTLESHSQPAEAEIVLERARRMREAIYRIFSAGALPQEDDLSLINEELACGLQRARIITAPTGYAWGWDTAETALDAMFAPIALAAADLLTSPALSRVRECASQTCTWLFIDETKNHSRRWCNMKTCGNKHKIKRFRSRQAGNV
jgi:predicted RNA-binding Zn ribbon-like protein